MYHDLVRRTNWQPIMPLRREPFYEYLEERPLGDASSVRRRNVPPVDDPFGTPDSIPNWEGSMYTLSSAYAIEGRIPTPETEGAWILTDFRVRRHTGDPGIVKWPYTDHQSAPHVDISSLRPCVRLHHYFRVMSSDDCRSVNRTLYTYCLGIKVTEEWHSPPNGILDSIPSSSPVLGTHCIGGLVYDPDRNLFVFPNSWGPSWGDNGRGYISPEIIDRYMVECWAMIGLAYYPPLITKSGIVAVLWKTGIGGQEVHGRELIEASTGERIGWCFLVRRDGFLDIEELFVWPSHRRNGYGSRLAQLAVELATQMGIPLRALVSYADAEPANREVLTRLMHKLRLHIHPSTLKNIPFIGLRNQYLGHIAEPQFPVRPTSTRDTLDPAKAPRLYKVWFGTNRKPKDQSDMAKGFSSQRDDQIHYGYCDVAIPKSHSFGSVGTNWFYRWLRTGSDDKLRIADRNCLNVTEFWTELNDALSKWVPDERHALIYIHGYNVDFDEAAIRAAQIGFDLKVRGITAFYSWPSCGTISGYPTDEATIEASEHFIADFLDDFAERSEVEQVHLIVHSMGNRGLLRALQRLSTNARRKSGVKFGQIILAAPDIDTDLFCQLAHLYRQYCDRTTLYASPKDYAVGASQWLHTYPRVGLVPPITVVPGIDTIQIPNLRILDLLGHSYYAEAEGVLHDIYDLLRRNAPPSDRQRLTESTSVNGTKYWIMYR